MLAGNQQQDRVRVTTAMATVRNAYNNTGKVKKFVNAVLLIISINPFFLAIYNLFLISLVHYVLKPKENETKLLVWPKNIIRAVLIAVLVISILAPLIFLMLTALCIFLLNREFVREVMQTWDLLPEAERQNLIQELMNNMPFLTQTTHDPRAVSSVNLSVDRLIEKYKDNLSKEEFYVKLNEKNTAEIEEYIKQSNEFTEEKKSHALKCLEFINKTTGDIFSDSYSKLSLKQIAVLSWKACSDIETGMEGEHVPLSDENIQNRKNMFINGLIDAATTYGNKGQSCAGGTYNKIIESLSGLHPLVVITLDEKQVSEMIRETIIKTFPETAREILGSFSEAEQEVVKGELSDITVSYIIKVYNSTLEQCKKFSSSFKDGEEEGLLKECMDNLYSVQLSGQDEAPDSNDEKNQEIINAVKNIMLSLFNEEEVHEKEVILKGYNEENNFIVSKFIDKVKEAFNKDFSGVNQNLDKCIIEEGFKHLVQVKSMFSQPEVVAAHRQQQQDSLLQHVSV